MLPSNVICHSDPQANMYGCQPCPKCGSLYRASYKRPDDLWIECDECGYKQRGHIHESEE